MVIDRQPLVGQSVEEDKLYTFSSKPSTPGEKSPDILVRFQAVSRTQPCIAHHYCKLNSKAKLSSVRQYINQFFKNYFSDGFIFLSKTKEILRSRERVLTLFDILPKVPCIYNKKKEKEVPNDAFIYPDVQYKKVGYEFEGKKYSIMCACVIFLYEASKVSHWPPEVLHEDLSANTIEGFCFIPTDIMSWKDKIVESRASSLHLHAACGAKKELELTMHQLPGKININHLRDQRGASPLHYAAENGQIDACEMLVTGIGKDLIYQRDLCDKTPLHCALYRRKAKTVTYLLQLNSDLSFKDTYGNSCLDLLLKQSDKDLEFIIYKLQIECIDDVLKFQLAWCTITKGNRPLSKYLAKHVTLFDFELHLGQSILHIAVKMKDRDVIETLISNGVDLKSRDIRDFLPFHTACQYGFVNIQTLFYKEMEDSDLCRGIQLALKSKNYSLCSAIIQLRPDLFLDEQTMCFVLNALDSELRKVHRDKHLEKDLKNWENIAKHLLPLVAKDRVTLNSYVFDCAFYGATETLSLLSSLGAEFDIRDQMGRTPLHEASQNNNVHVLEYLLAEGVDPNRTDWRGSTPLHYACAKNNLQVVTALMAIPVVNAGAQDNCGRTPLLVSAYHKRLDVVHYLIRKHIDRVNLHAVDVYGHSILHYTVNLNESCIELLLANISSVEKSESKLRRGLKRWRDTSDYRAWLRDLVGTEFRLQHASLSADDRQEKHPSAAFSYKKEKFSRDTAELPPENQTRQCKRPVTKCVKCDKYLSHKKKKRTRFAGRHICYRNCLETKPGDDGRKRMKVKPFAFHSFDYSESITPLLQAIRGGQTNLMKRLNRFDHSYKETLDSQNRTLLEFAVDQNSVVMLKMIFDLKPVVQRGLMHRILMQKVRNRKETTRRHMVEFLLSKGYSSDEIPETGEITHDIGTCAWGNDERNPKCSRDCHLKAYTVLEVSVRNNEEDIFKLLLDSTTNFQHNFLLNLLAHNGNVWMIESFLKKRTKIRPMSVDIDKLDDLDSCHILDIACCSKKLSTVLIQSLVKVTPDVFVNACVTDPDEYSVQSRPEVEWNMMYEMTTLGKLMSKDHPLAKLKNKDGRERVENTACFLIDSGIQLDDLVNDYESRLHVHGVCEAFMCAMENGYYRAAASLLEEAGDVFWDCAMNINRCKVQINFSKTKYRKFSRLPDRDRIRENAVKFKHAKKHLSPFHFSVAEAGQFQRFLDLKRDFLKYHLLLACEEAVPENVLRELLRAGREFFDTVEYPVPDINLDEIHDNRFDAVCEIDDPIIRLLLCVCELMSAYSLFKKRYDVLRLLKLAPALYPYLHLVDRDIFFEPINRGRGSLILQRCVNLAYRKPENRKLKKIIMSDGTTLLHLVSSGDSVDIVKSILKAETHIDIDCIADNDLRPIDVAVACGSWNVYKLFCDSGALITGQTLVACCATEKFLGIETWANHIRGFRYTERGIEKSRVKIVKDICERDGIDIFYEHPEYGSAVENAVKFKYWEIMEYFNKRRWSLIKASLQKDGNVASVLFRDGPDRLLTKILQSLEKNITAVCRAALQQIVLQSANRNSSVILNAVVNIICEKHPHHSWADLLNVKDKYGMGALHYASSRGYHSSVKIWAEKIGNFYYKPTCKLDAYDSYTRTDSPVYYALANKHLDIALCLLLNGSMPSFKRSIPDFYIKGRFRVIHSDGKSEPACLADKNFWTSDNREKSLLRITWKEKRTFPTEVNISENVLPCLCPDLKNDKKSDALQNFNTPKYKVKTERISVTDSNTVKKKYVKHILNLVRIASNNKCCLIHVACVMGDIALVQELLKLHPNLTEAEDSEGILPYIYAVAGGNTDVIDLMKTNLNQRNVEEAIKVLVWKCVTKDIENAKHPIQNDNFQQDSTNSKVYVDKRKFKIMLRFLSAFEVDEFDSHTEDGASRDYGNLLLLDTLQELKEKFCTYNIRKRWTSTSFVKSDGKYPYLFSEEYLLELLEYVLRDIDPRKLDVKLILAIIASGRPKLLEALLKTWKVKEETFNSFENPLIGNFSILDCIIICIESLTVQSKSFTFYLEQYRAIVEELISTANIYLHPEVVQIAVKKKLWILFEPVARKLFQNKEVELDSFWLEILAVSIEDGQLSFFKTILDLIGFPKMPEEEKQNFIPFLYLACRFGKSDIVKYLLRYNIPVCGAVDHMAMLDILGSQYQGSWSVLHYAVKSGCLDVMKIILRSCRYNALYLQTIPLEDLFRLAVGLNDISIFQLLEEYFVEVLGNSLTLTELERLLLYSARKGYSDVCKLLLSTKELSVFTADLENSNSVHFAAIYNMKGVAELVMKFTPDVIKLTNSYGLTPVDYAYALGNIEMLSILSSKPDLNVKPNDAFFDTFGWLRGLLERNAEQIQTLSECRPAIPVDKGLCLEGMLLRSDDHAASFFIDCARHFLEKCIHNNVIGYGKLFNLAARFGCSKSIQSLFEIVDADILPKILSMNYENLTPIAWAVKTSNLRVVEIIAGVDKEKLSSTWKAPITEENLLHIAVKTGKLDMVMFIDKWTEGLLRTIKDRNGVIPGVCAVALGFHHLLTALYEERISEEYHTRSHGNSSTEYTCIECLLDLGIGWSKNLHNQFCNRDGTSYANITRPITTCVSARGMVYVRRFQFNEKSLWINDKKWKGEWRNWLNGKPTKKNFIKYLRRTRRIHKLLLALEWCRFRTDHIVIESLMRSMGYGTDPRTVAGFLLSLEERHSNTCPPLKMLRLQLHTKSVIGDLGSSQDTEILLFEVAASTGNKQFFEKNTESLNSLSGRINEKFSSDSDNLSLSEIAYSFGHSELGKYLEDELTRFGFHGIYRSFQSLRSILPQKILWALKLELPGDDNWKIEEEVRDRKCRLTKADIWLTANYPNTVLQDIEQDVIPESIIPPKCANKKFNPDVDGFRKQSCFSGKSDIWIRCLMASSMIYGHTYDVLQMDESRFTTVSSLRILCIPADTADHAKTVIEQTGTYIESVGLHNVHGSVSLQNDNTQHQRVTEAKLRDNIHHTAIPQIIQKIQDVFGLKVSIKIDWRTVDSQKRTSGSDTILRLLSSEAGNTLAGLEDTLLHCEEMKNEINYMYNQTTVKFAIAPVSSIREVIIKYVDTLPNLETVFQRKFTQFQTTCFWHFSIERSTLKYDRATFRLWHYMQLYHGSCLSLLDPIHRIVSTDTEIVSKKKRKKRPLKSVTLEIDWNSFGVTEPYTTHALMTQKVAREVLAIVQHCESMFHLKLSGDHVIIQNTTSSKYTGVTPIYKLLTINVYAHQLKNKEWEVSSENTFTKLSELEDKELLGMFPTTLMTRITKSMYKLQEKIVSETGIPARVFIDEKRLLSLTFCKSRRDIVHPKALIKKGIKDLFYCLPIIYSRILSFILESPASTFCRVVSKLKVPSGIWAENRMSSKNKNVCLLALCCDDPDMETDGTSFSKRRQYFKTFTLEKFVVSNNVTSGPWTRQHLNTCFENVRSLDHQAIKYISFDNILYQVLDSCAMIEIFSHIQTKFVLHDLLFDRLENISDVRLADKIFPSPVHSLTKVCPQPSIVTLSQYLKQQPKLKRFLPDTIGDKITIDWKSFYSDAKHYREADRLLLDVVYSFINSYCHFAERFKLIQRKESLCTSQESSSKLLCKILKNLSFILHKKSDKINLAGGMKLKQKGNPDINLLTEKAVQLSYSDSPVQTDFSENLQSVIIRMLESEIKSRLGCSHQNTDENSGQRRQSVHASTEASLSVLKSRPRLDIILQAHLQLREALAEISKSHNGADLRFLQHLHEVCYINSTTSKTVLKYIDDTLKIQISPRDISKSSFVKELYKIPDLRSQLEHFSNGKLNFITSGYTPYFVCKSKNTLTINAVDSFGNLPGRFLLDAHSDKETFRIVLWKADEDKEDAADQAEQTSCLKTGPVADERFISITSTKTDISISKSLETEIGLSKDPERDVKIYSSESRGSDSGYATSMLSDDERKQDSPKSDKMDAAGKHAYENEIELSTEKTGLSSEGDQLQLSETETEDEMEEESAQITGKLESIKLKTEMESSEIDRNGTSEKPSVTKQSPLSDVGETVVVDEGFADDATSNVKEILHSIVEQIGKENGKIESEGEIVSSQKADEVGSSRMNNEMESPFREIDVHMPPKEDADVYDAESDIKEILYNIVEKIENRGTESPQNVSKTDSSKADTEMDSSPVTSDMQSTQMNGDMELSLANDTTSNVRGILYDIIEKIEESKDLSEPWEKGTQNRLDEKVADKNKEDVIETSFFGMQGTLPERIEETNQTAEENKEEISRKASVSWSKEMEIIDRVDSGIGDGHTTVSTTDLTDDTPSEILREPADEKSVEISIDDTFDTEIFLTSIQDREIPDYTDSVNSEPDGKAELEGRSDIVLHRLSEKAEVEKIEITPEKVRICNDTIQITWDASNLNFDGRTHVELLHYGRRIEIPETIHFFNEPDLHKDASYLGSVHGIKLDRDGFIVLLLEHDKCSHIKYSMDEFDPIAEVCKQKLMPLTSPVFKSDKFDGVQTQFHIFTSPKRYGKGNLLPIKFEPLSVLPEDGTWKWMFCIRSLDPARQARLRATCRLCRQYLKMVTPLNIVEPGKELVINSLSD